MKYLIACVCIAVLLFVSQVDAIYTPNNACVAHKFSCCPDNVIDFKVNIDYLKDGLEQRVCKEIADFAASKENVSAECLKAHIEFTCLKRIPRCASDSDRHVSQLCRGTCVNRQAICLAHVSKNPLYFDSLCPSQTNPSACIRKKTLSDDIFEQMADDISELADEYEEGFDEEEE